MGLIVYILAPIPLKITFDNSFNLKMNYQLQQTPCDKMDNNYRIFLNPII